MPHLMDAQGGCSAPVAPGSAIGVKPFMWAIGFASRRLMNALHTMACIPQARNNHGLRLTPIETDLETFTAAHLFEGELAANEIHWTGRSPQIQGTPAHPF